MRDSSDEYTKWKGWNADNSPTYAHEKYFMEEVNACGLKPPANLLEIGFGNGEFLNWAEKNDYYVVGVEVSPVLVKNADKNGFQVCCANLSKEIPKENIFSQMFKYVVMFDVIEHLNAEDSVCLMKNLYKVCEPGAKMMLRFPNGASPMSLQFQNGDLTHQQCITESKLKQICVNTGWSVSLYKNASRTLGWVGKGGFLRLLVYPLRNFIEWFIGNLYYGKRTALDPVAVAVLIRDEG